jgi:DNA-binding transcriptional LysR family regulator
VARAARRLRLSPSAMSRALARLRETTGDPLLVRAGRGLVPTPRALELREQVSQLVQDAEAVLRPLSSSTSNSSEHSRCGPAMALWRTSDRISLLVSARRPPVCGCVFVQKTNKDSTPLRDGSVDLETGVVDQAISPEVRTLALFRDRLHRRRAKRSPADPGQDHSRALCVWPAYLGFALRNRKRTDRSRLWSRSACSAKSSWPSSAASRPRWRSRAPPTWSPVVPERHTGNCAPGCIVFRCRSPRPSSRFRCYGIRAWTVTRPIAGCAGASARSRKAKSR